MKIDMKIDKKFWLILLPIALFFSLVINFFGIYVNNKIISVSNDQAKLIELQQKLINAAYPEIREKLRIY